MLEPARIASAVELVGQCYNAWQGERKLPADIVIHRYFRERRFIGSKDRAAISQLVYFTIRNHLALSWWAQRHRFSSPRALIIATLVFSRGFTATDLKTVFDGKKFSEQPLTEPEAKFAADMQKHELLHKDMPEHVRCNVPEWMLSDIKVSLGDNWMQEITALNEEAPVDLRTNTLLTTREALLDGLRNEGFNVEETPHSPLGIRMSSRAPVFTSQYFKQGWFEMQDEGSQLVSLMLEAKAGDRVIDFCAGAGGKTLAIAAAMQNKGRILAWDTSESRLKQMDERLRRAKVDNVQKHLITSEADSYLKRHRETADAVIVDAPCSGSGTWRRNPDLKWRTSESDLQEIISVQQKILQSASRLVKRGGLLLYVTCSFFNRENEQQIAAFLSQAKNFKVVTNYKICSNFFYKTVNQDGMFRITPHKDGTDGFFAAKLQRVE